MSQAPTLRIHVSSLGKTFSLPLHDPYDRCFWAVARALNGKPGQLAAMQAVAAAKADYLGARHDDD